MSLTLESDVHDAQPGLAHKSHQVETPKYQAGPATGRLRRQAIRLHRHRYNQLGYLNAPERDPYDNRSTWFAATDPPGRVVGVTRLVHLPVSNLPTLANFFIDPALRHRFEQLANESCTEIGALVSKPGHHALLPLLKAAYYHSIRHGMTHWFCCIDHRVHRYLERRLGLSFDIIGESQIYWGSTTVPCYLYLPIAFAAMRPEIQDYFNA